MAYGVTAPAPEPGEPEPEEPELDPLWLKLPAELADFFDLGFAHAEPECPVVVFRARDTDSQSSVEISGPPISFLGLADVIAALCKSVPCIAHETGAEVARQQAS
jgi:hypothetical protein